MFWVTLLPKKIKKNFFSPIFKIFWKIKKFSSFDLKHFYYGKIFLWKLTFCGKISFCGLVVYILNVC